MPHDVIMPALGMAQDTGLIVSWHKGPGDAVAEGDVLFEVETDKATMEVEAQVGGFLTQVRAHAGDEVPVGDVIAVISAENDAVHTEESTTGTASQSAGIPEGTGIIMPALGMAQDTGLIVAWHKSPGDAVTAGDVLFEVETDKSTMEVEAGHDGFVAALLAEAGEEAPVGETIAVISADRPENPVQISRAGASVPPASTPAVAPTPVAAAKTPAKLDEQPKPKHLPPATTDGRILASPKARRLAMELGLDLGRLVQAGHPQPYHVADIDVLKTLPDKATAPAHAAARRLTADVPTDGFTAFAAWAADAAGLTDIGALLAGFAGASLGRHATVAVESFGTTRAFSVPAGPLADVAPSDEACPDLLLRDLRMSRITGVELGAEDTPVLTLTASATGLAITLECASDSLSAPDAIALLSNFAARMEDPVRNLL